MGAQPQPPIQSTLLPQRRLAAISLAAFFYLVLADVAVETFLSAAPIRWWVAGAVTLYFVFTVAVWRGLPAVWKRIAWPARASASFFVLLGLLTFTAWLPGGLTDGIKLFGQPTSRVLSLLTFAAIVLAGISLARTAWLPRWAKFAVGVVATYGLAAFARGIISGTSYPDLLHGESLWTRLPSWLQGAFVGALIVIPAGLLLRATQMLKAAPGESRTWDLRQVVAMAMTVLMAVSAVTSTGAFGPQPSAAEIVQPLAKSYQELQQALAGPKPKMPSTPQQIADRLDKLFPMLEQAEHQIPRDTFDPQVIIDKVGKDPKKLFEWERDNTYFVPYKGLLRGEKGVLMDRLGNSLDRAMLLYALLQFANESARLAHGTLTEAQAKDVLQKVRPFPSFEQRTGSGSSASATGAFIKQYAEQNRLDASKIRKALDQVAAQQQRVKELVQKRVAAQAALIARAVGRPPKSALENERAEQVRAVTDHWWVQWQSGGHWVDFDPTLPDSKPAQTLTSMQSSVAPKNYTDLGADLVHTVQIQVVIEVWRDGQVKKVPVLTQQLVPAETIGKPIILRQVPVYWPTSLNMFQEKDPLGRFTETILQQTEWLPVLSIGSETVFKYSFDDFGELTDATLPGVYATKKLAKHTVDLLEHPGQQPGINKHDSNSRSSQVAGEWIEYEIRTPGSSWHRIRRNVIDLLSRDARLQTNVQVATLRRVPELYRKLRLVNETELLLANCALAPDSVQDLIVSSALEQAKALSALLTNSGNSSNDASATIRAAPSVLYWLTLARNNWSLSGSELYYDRVNVFSRFQRIQANASAEFTVRRGIDIIDNSMGVRFGPRGYIHRIEQGVLDTNAENIFLASPSSQNTAEYFNVSLSHGEKWITIRYSNDPNLRRMQFNDEAASLIEQDLLAGYVVTIPSGVNPDVTAWWRSDPITGETLGMGTSGGFATEEATLEARVAVGVIQVGFCLVTALLADKVGQVKLHEAPWWGPVVYCAIIGAACGSYAGCVTNPGEFLSIYLTSVFVFWLFSTRLVGMGSP